MSNQDYTQSGQDAHGMDQDQYGSMRDPDPVDPRRMNPNQMDPNQMGQGDRDMYNQPQGSSTGGMGATSDASDREYGVSDQYAQSGTLNQGYGQGQQMGEDQWSQQGGHMNRDQSDPMRGDIGASASDRFEREMRDRAGGGGDTGEDFRDMVGGMYGEDDDSQPDR
jgi:hypothetical protein